MASTQENAAARSKLRKPLIVLGCIWIALFLLSVALPNLLTQLTFVAVNAALPFIVVFLVLFAAGFFGAVERVGWLKLLWVAGGFVYLVYANKWAGDVLNDIFKVDPSFFPTTSKVLTVAFGPLSLYGSSIWSVFQALALITFSLVIFMLLPIVLTSLTLWQQFWAQGWRWLALAFAMLVVWVPISSVLGYKYPLLVERLAVWADFNDKHRCSNDEARGALKVVFLRDGYVLALRAKHGGGTEYVVLRCLYERPAP